MTHRIEADATLCESRQVAEMAGHIPMCGFVQRDRKKHGKRIDGNGLYELTKFHRRENCLKTGF